MTQKIIRVKAPVMTSNIHSHTDRRVDGGPKLQAADAPFMRRYFSVRPRSGGDSRPESDSPW